MHSVDLGDLTIRHSLDGTGEPMVLITGLGGDMGFWKGLVPLLRDRMTVVSLDNRGAGRTLYPDSDFTITDMADDVSRLMCALGHDRYHVLGWSMGGNVAQQLAVDRPEEVASLTLMSTYTRRPARSSFAIGTMARMVREGASKDSLDMMMQAFCLTESAFLRRESEATGRRGHEYDMEGFERQMAALELFDSAPYVGGIDSPTMVIHGEEDIMVPPSMGRDLSSMIPGSMFVTIPGAGHNIHPRLYADLVVEHVLSNAIEKGKGFVSSDDPQHILTDERGTIQ